jgi:hypothetical protein
LAHAVPDLDTTRWCNVDVSSRRAKVWTPKPGGRAAETAAMVILLSTVALALASLIWLAAATTNAHLGQVRWELWIPSKTQVRDYRWDLTLTTGTAAAIATVAMLVLMVLAAVGNAPDVRRNPHKRKISVPSQIACVCVMPLTLSLPVQFAAYAQTGGWAGDGHAMELVVRYGPFPAIVLGFVLLTVAEVVVGIRS